MKTRIAILVAIALGCALAVMAETPSNKTVAAAENARLAWEKSQDVAEAAVEDDGFMSTNELAKLRQQARSNGDAAKKVAWDQARMALEGHKWSLEPDKVKVAVGSWDRDRKQWDVAVESLDKSVPFVSALVWNIADQAEAKTLYACVTRLVKDKALGARISYNVLWQQAAVWISYASIELLDNVSGDSLAIIPCPDVLVWSSAAGKLAFVSKSKFKYADINDIMLKMVSATNGLVVAMDKALTGKQVAEALDAYMDSLSELSAKMRVLRSKYPELEMATEPPRELKDSYDMLDAMGEKLMACMSKLQNFADDPDVTAATERMAALSF
jgi:hypothetical protein